MVRSCERIGWSGGKLDLVWTFLLCIDDLAWFLKALLCCSSCSWWWFSVPSFRGFLGVFSGPCSWGFVGGNLWEPFVVLWAVIPLPNPWVKGLDSGVFGVLGLEEVLAGFLRFLLIWQVWVDKIMAMDSVERFRRLKFGFGGVDPRVLSIPSCPGYTGLTGALDWSVRCKLPVGFASGKLLDSCVFGSLCCWSVLGLFGVVLLGFV
jgi:hypothetical protein